MSPSLQLKELSERIVHVTFPTPELLARTFLRFQEFYESPEFRGKVFSHEDFLREYGSSYAEDWAGFNIPSSVLKPFFEGRFNPLTQDEQSFLELFRGRQREFYVIGTVQGDESELTHEIAHALFFTSLEYKKTVRTLLKGINTASITQFLKEEGYHSAVWEDEVQAYLLGDLELLKEKGIDLSKFQKEIQFLATVFKKHVKTLQISPLPQ